MRKATQNTLHLLHLRWSRCLLHFIRVSCTAVPASWDRVWGRTLPACWRPHAARITRITHTSVPAGPTRDSFLRAAWGPEVREAEENPLGRAPVPTGLLWPRPGGAAGTRPPPTQTWWGGDTPRRDKQKSCHFAREQMRPRLSNISLNNQLYKRCTVLWEV